MKFHKLPADQYGKGYPHHRLREDVAVWYLEAYGVLRAAGGILTSSGSKRNLQAHVSRGRSATSMHYLGRAFDLYLYSGMQDPATDPYVIIPRSRGRWRVYARAECGQEMTLSGWKWRKGKRPLIRKVTDRFVDLTALLRCYGFHGISRRSGYRHHYGCTEWWHFQHTVGLKRKQTTFGSELLKVYSEDVLRHTPPWRSRDLVYGVDWR
jgi:hypothetical protein